MFTIKYKQIFRYDKIIILYWHGHIKIMFQLSWLKIDQRSKHGIKDDIKKPKYTAMSL